MRYWVNEIEFSDNKKISFKKGDIVILVGPNNAGKSASLKKIMKLVLNKILSKLERLKIS